MVVIKFVHKLLSPNSLWALSIFFGLMIKPLEIEMSRYWFHLMSICAGFAQAFLKHLEIAWNSLKHLEIAWNILKHLETSRNILKHLETSWNILKLWFGLIWGSGFTFSIFLHPKRRSLCGPVLHLSRPGRRSCHPLSWWLPGNPPR